MCMLIFNISVCSLVETSETHCLQFQTSSVSSRGLKACLTCQSSPTSKQFRAEHFTSEQVFSPSVLLHCICSSSWLRSCHYHVFVSALQTKPLRKWIWLSFWILYLFLPLSYLIFTPFRGVSSRRYSKYFTCLPISASSCRTLKLLCGLCDWVGVGKKSLMISRGFLACCFWYLLVFGCKIGIRKSGWYFMKQRKYFILKTIHGYYYFLKVHKFRQEMKVIWIWWNSNTKIQIYKSNTSNTWATNDNHCRSDEWMETWRLNL